MNRLSAKGLRRMGSQRLSGVCRCTVRLLPRLTLSLACFAQLPAQTEWTQLALQNEVLRDHYREEYRLRTGRTGVDYENSPPFEEREFTSSLGRVVRNLDEEREIERFVTRQIQILTSETEKGSLKIESALQIVTQACDRSTDAPEKGREEARKRLREISKVARELGKRFEAVFTKLDRKENSLRASPQDTGTVCSLDGLRHEIEATLPVVRDTLAGNSVVSAEQPERWNILVGFSRISRLANELSEASWSDAGRY